MQMYHDEYKEQKIIIMQTYHDEYKVQTLIDTQIHNLNIASSFVKRREENKDLQEAQQQNEVDVRV